MAESNRRQLEFIARLTYTLPALSSKLRLYFSQFLYFHFSQTLSRDLIQNTENKKATIGFASEEEMKEFTSSLNASQLAWCVGVISMFRKLASEAGDKVIAEKLDRLVKQLIVLFQLDSTTVITSQQLTEKEVEQFRNRPLIRIPVSIWPMVLDFTLRCFVIAVVRPEPNILAVFNILIIPVSILTMTLLIHRRDRKYNRALLEQYGQSHQFKIEPYVSISNYSWLAAFIGLGVFISYLLTVPLHGLAFFGLTVYYFLYLRVFYVGRLTENSLAAQVNEARHEKSDFDYDTNDEEIVQLETRLNSSTGRLEAYVLESALFGALTFSGFLQIMASDLVLLSDLENFADSMFDISRAVIQFDWATYNDGLSRIANKVSLLCVVSIESLLCSIFFLAVIASRLRFSDVADSVRTAINMAKTFNDKEESLAAAATNDNDRLSKLTTKINEQLHIANNSLEKANPIIAYMQYFRNAGILMFLVILITSSLFITGVLGWTFMALVFATFLYFNYSRISVSVQAAYLFLRIQLARNGHWVVVAAIAPILFASISKGTFLWPYANVFAALGFIIAGVYGFTWLTVVAHVDEEFGDIEHRVGTWRWIKTTLAIVCLGLAASLSFKRLQLSGADELILIFITALSVSMYFVGYFLTRVRWLGIICGAMLAVSVIGILFKILHLNGADQMMLIGVVSALIWTPIIIWKRKLFHSLFLRFVFVIAFVAFVMVSGLVWKAELMFGHRQWNVGEIEHIIVANTEENLLDGDIDESIRLSDWYIEKYGAKPGYALAYVDLVRNYNHSCSILLSDSSAGPERLEKALKLARQAQKITNLFPSYEIWNREHAYEYEARALKALGRAN